MNEDFFIDKTSSVRAALAKISANKHRIVFVFDSFSQTVVGAFSDGDFRRSVELSSSVSILEDEVGVHCNTGFKFISENDHSTDVALLYRDGVSVVPVLDPQGRCVNLRFSSGEVTFDTIGIGQDHPCFVISKLETIMAI